MANIQTFLEKILSARYGKDVRQSIHDAIVEIDGVADTAQTSATAQAEAARKSAQTSELKAEAAATSEANAKTYMEAAGTSEANSKSYMQSAKTSEENAKVSETNAKASENSAKEYENSAKLTEERAREVFESIPEDYSTISNDLYELAIKETASGEEIHVNDSSNLKLREFALYGKAKQDGEPTPENPQPIEVSGESYNLLKNIATSKKENGGNITVNDDKSITFNGTFTATTFFNVDYVDSIDNAENDITGIVGEKLIASISDSDKNGITLVVGYFRADRTKVNIIITTKTFSEVVFPSEAYKSRSYLIIESGTYNNVTVYPMIRKASVKNARYMPYGKGSVEVKSCGKNLLKNEAVTTTNNGITYTVEKDGSIHIVGKKTGTTFIDILGGIASNYKTEKLNLKGKFRYTTSTYGKLKFRKTDGTYIADLTSVQNIGCSEIGAVYFQVESNETVDFTYYPQIEYGDKVTEYEPYKETLSTIPTENGLAGIKVSSGGNYTDQNGQQWICDEVVKYADGSGEKIQRIKKILVDGKNYSFYDKSASTKNTIYMIKATDIKLPNSGNEIANIHSTRFTPYSSNYCFNNNVIGIYGNASYKNIYCAFGLDSELTTLELAKSWLVENYFEVYYELADPIRTPLTAEEIAEIEKLHTFYPVTNISNDFDCGMKVMYKCDGKNYIDNKLAQIAAAMVNNI